jgi:hypothetical protein
MDFPSKYYPELLFFIQRAVKPLPSGRGYQALNRAAVAVQCTDE